MKKIISIVCVLFALLMVLSIPVGAAQAYTTYTYSISGTPLYSPDAYTAEKIIDYNTMRWLWTECCFPSLLPIISATIRILR